MLSPRLADREADLDDPPTVLIVEDEPLICALLVEALEDDGVVATCAATPDEADGELARHGASLRILVTDINLRAVRTGFDVARAARKALPGLTVFYVTGHAEADTGAQGVPGGVVVPKPYLPGELAQRIANLLRA